MAKGGETTQFSVFREAYFPQNKHWGKRKWGKTSPISFFCCYIVEEKSAAMTTRGCSFLCEQKKLYVCVFSDPRNHFADTYTFSCALVAAAAADTCTERERKSQDCRRFPPFPIPRIKNVLLGRRKKVSELWHFPTGQERRGGGRCHTVSGFRKSGGKIPAAVPLVSAAERGGRQMGLWGVGGRGKNSGRGRRGGGRGGNVVFSRKNPTSAAALPKCDLHLLSCHLER